MSKRSTHNLHLLPVAGSPSTVRLVVVACGASAGSEKTRPWNFGACILWILSFFNDFRAPQALCGCVAAACGASAPSKKHAPGFLNTYIVNLVDFHGFEAPLVKFSKSGQSVQMTMPARCASKFSAKRRAVTPEVFSESLIPQGIPGFCEPWSECQPEESRPPEGQPEDSSIYIYMDI